MGKRETESRVLRHQYQDGIDTPGKCRICRNRDLFYLQSLNQYWSDLEWVLNKYVCSGGVDKITQGEWGKDEAQDGTWGGPLPLRGRRDVCPSTEGKQPSERAWSWGGQGKAKMRRKRWAMSVLSRKSQENHAEPKAVATTRSLVNFGEVIFTDTLEAKAMFQRTEEWSERV